MKPDDRPHLQSLCPAEEILQAYNLGKLAVADGSSIKAHVDICPRCLATLQMLDDQGDSLVAELRRPVAAEPAYLPECQNVVDRVAALCLEWTRSWHDPAEAPTEAPTEDAARPRMDLDLRQLGPYELLQPLGEGGMGAVYKARHAHLGKIVALKLLPQQRMKDSAAVARFYQEMKAVGKLNHPNIVQAYDAGEVSGTHYLAMEYIDGIDLARLVHRRGPLPVADACELVRQAAVGLQHAHEHGLVHRDIKPSNLMLTPASGGRQLSATKGSPEPQTPGTQPCREPQPAGATVKLLDLGLARLRSALPGDPSLTGSSVMMGTPDYMAPEQIYDAHSVDIRADIYSLGCTLYHLLAGHTPFPGPEYDTPGKKCKAHLQEPVPSIRERRPAVPVDLAVVLDRLLAKEPAHRFATPAEVATVLQPFTSGSNLAALLGSLPAVSEPLAETPVPSPLATAPLSRPSRRWTAWRRWAVAAAVFLTGCLLAAIVAVWQPFSGRGKIAGPLRIESLAIAHYRVQDGQTMHRGQLGAADLATVRFDDLVRVSARFSEPAYCYLVAYNPNGTEQLCYPYPEDKNRPPEQVAELQFPRAAASAFRLNDGVGLQAFVLMASRQPLPAYAEWQARHGGPSWRPTGGGAWRYQDRRFQPLAAPHRGQVEELPVPPGFQELCRGLAFEADRQGIEAFEALAFTVGPKGATKITRTSVPVKKPPSLHKWLKGRKVLTVAQDGSGQFRTIQEALDNLKSGQVVKVLDKGPYRERLETKNPREDVGLISEVGTRIEFPDWKRLGGTQNYLGLQLIFPKGFRLSGLEISGPTAPADAKALIAIHLQAAGDLTVESCRIYHNPRYDFLAPVANDPSFALFTAIYFEKPHWVVATALWVEGNHFDGGLEFHDFPATVMIQRNHIFGWRNCAILVPERTGDCIIRHNIIHGWFGIGFNANREARFQEYLAEAWYQIANNVFDNVGGSPVFLPPPKDAKNRLAPPKNVSIKNNIFHSQDDMGINLTREDLQDTKSAWQVGHNCYLAEPRSVEEYLAFPKQPSDLVFPFPFLSTNPKDTGYLRIPANSPLATKGAGGDLPEYIGAFPPGPAPKEGDWFTHLQEGSFGKLADH